MPNTVALTFKSLELSEIRVRGQPDDFALSTLRLDLAYSTGRGERDVIVQIWHGLDPLTGGTIRLITSIGHHDPICQPHVARSIEHFYRQRAAAQIEALGSDARAPGRASHAGVTGASIVD